MNENSDTASQAETNQNANVTPPAHTIDDLITLVRSPQAIFCAVILSLEAIYPLFSFFNSFASRNLSIIFTAALSACLPVLLAIGAVKAVINPSSSGVNLMRIIEQIQYVLMVIATIFFGISILMSIAGGTDIAAVLLLTLFFGGLLGFSICLKKNIYMVLKDISESISANALSTVTRSCHLKGQIIAVIVFMSISFISSLFSLSLFSAPRVLPYALRTYMSIIMSILPATSLILEAAGIVFWVFVYQLYNKYFSLH